MVCELWDIVQMLLAFDSIFCYCRYHGNLKKPTSFLSRLFPRAASIIIESSGDEEEAQ